MFTGPPELMPHQQLMRQFIADHPHAGLYIGIGGGKTLSTLSALWDIRPSGHILVVAPVAIARSTWIDEIEKWQFPLRTKSLIVNESDRKLSKDKRLERYQEVFNDPPTMYFINQDLLTQPSQKEHLLSAVPHAVTPPAQPLSAEATEMLDLLRRHGLMSRDALLLAHREHVAQRTGTTKLPAKAHAQAWLKELQSAQLIQRDIYDCRTCTGAGCRDCQYGLIDQMPVRTINGKKQLIWPFSTVVLDESQNFKNWASNRFKAMKKVRPAITRMIQLTGTPTPNGLLDLWSQMYLLDQGTSLGPNITSYKNTFFQVTQTIDNRPVAWEPLPGMTERIHQLVAPFVMSTENTDIPLPDVTIDDINVTLPKDAMAAYKDFAKNLVLDLATPDPNNPQVYTITADSAAILHGKLIQFASGTMYVDDQHNHVVVHREKLEIADYLIRNSAGAVLLAYRNISDKKELLAHLTKEGHHVEEFDGSREMVRRWNTGAIPVMLLHPASAGPGLNLQDGGHTLIWYTLPDSLEHYEQLNGRLVRIGQQHPVQILRMITKGTRDARAPRNLENKSKIQNGLLSAVRIDPYDMEDIEDLLGDLDINPL